MVSSNDSTVAWKTLYAPAAPPLPEYPIYSKAFSVSVPQIEDYSFTSAWSAWITASTFRSVLARSRTTTGHLSHWPSQQSRQTYTHSNSSQCHRHISVTYIISSPTSPGFFCSSTSRWPRFLSSSPLRRPPHIFSSFSSHFSTPNRQLASGFGSPPETGLYDRKYSTNISSPSWSSERFAQQTKTPVEVCEVDHACTKTGASQFATWLYFFRPGFPSSFHSSSL